MSFRPIRRLQCEYCGRYTLHYAVATILSSCVVAGFFTCGLAWLMLPIVAFLPGSFLPWACSVCGLARKG